MLFECWGHNSFGIDPQTLQIIKLPDRLIEHMDDHMAIIQQDPVAVFGTFSIDGVYFVLF